MNQSIAETLVTFAITAGIPAICVLLWRLGTQLGSLTTMVAEHDERLDRLEARKCEGGCK